MGLTVIAEATDTHSALRLARSARPGLVVIDIQKCDHQAIDPVSTILKENLAPVLLVTTHQYQNFIDLLDQYPTMSFVIKPLNRWMLESTVHTLLANFRKISEMENEINRLKDTLETRKLVEKAKYIVMRDLGLAEAEAFRRMQKHSMDKGLPMRELAEGILSSGKTKYI